MDEAIKLLREQTVLCSRLTELLDKLEESLKNNSHDTARIVQKIDPLVIDLNKNATNTQKFLEASNFKTFGEFIESAAAGVEKDVAYNLLKKVVSSQEKLAKSMQIAAQLLVNGSEFVNFNLNVLSRTQASPTYGSEAQTATNSNRRLIDANI